MCNQCGCQSGLECSCNQSHSNCECGCHAGHRFERRFQTKAEQIEDLEAYLSELKTEVQAVEEHLSDLRK